MKELRDKSIRAVVEEKWSEEGHKGRYFKSIKGYWNKSRDIRTIVSIVQANSDKQ